jgi:FkbM family methyltransferase
MANLIHLAKPFHSLLFRSRLLRGFSGFLLKTLLPARLETGDATVCLNPADPVISAALALGFYEKDELAFFKKAFAPGMAFVDVGANIGLFTALALSRGASRILAVEPHAESRSFLEKTVAANSPKIPVSIEGVAAGAEPGTLELFANPFNKGDNRTASAPGLELCGRVGVEKLDDLCAKHGVQKIDFLKIDVQGGELGVLRGAAGILGASPDCILLSEVWPGGMSRCGTSQEEFVDCLRELGFTIRRVFGRSGNTLPKPSKDFADYTNLVATKGSVSIP